jgi:hypothetical protein
VLPAELRAQVLADLGSPVWATPRPKRPTLEPKHPTIEVLSTPIDAPFAPGLGAMLLARVGQLALIFVVVTLLVLAMSLVANAMR